MTLTHLAWSIFAAALAALIVGLSGGTFGSGEDLYAQNLSHLGEGGSFTAIVFNLCEALAGILTMRLARELSLRLPPTRTPLRRYAAQSLRIAGGCMVGVALFPLDVWPGLHQVFGYTLPFAFLAFILAGALLLPHHPRFQRSSYLLVAILLTAFLLCLGIALIPLLPLEIIGTLSIFYWLTRFIALLDR